MSPQSPQRKVIKDDPFTRKIIGLAIEVHRHLGPGLLESTYQNCLVHEFDINGINYEAEVALPVHYKGCELECGYRIDLLVENRLILELKSVEKGEPHTQSTDPDLHETFCHLNWLVDQL